MKLSFINGSTFVFSTPSQSSTKQCALESINGLGTQKSVSYIQAPGQKSMTKVGNIYTRRQIVIKFTLLGNNSTDMDNRRATLFDAFSIESTGCKLKIITNKTYYADVDTAEVYYSEYRENELQSGVIVLHAPDPLFYAAETTISMNAFSSGLSLPLSLPLSVGIAGYRTTITNAGNADTPIKVEMTGSISNPILQNVTYTKKIDLSNAGGFSITSTEQVKIDGSFNKQTIIKIAGGTTSNYRKYLSEDSEIFTLRPGKNVLTYAASLSFGNPTFKVQYCERYQGI